MYVNEKKERGRPKKRGDEIVSGMRKVGIGEQDARDRAKRRYRSKVL